MHVNLDVRQVGDIHAQRSGVIADEADLAVRAAVFQSDDVVLSQQRRNGGDLPLLIRIHPLQFQGTNARHVRFFLRQVTNREASKQAEN